MTKTSRAGFGHLGAEAAGDLVAHAGEAVFHVVAAGRARLPELVQFARQAAGGAEHDVAWPAMARCTAPITWASLGKPRCRAPCSGRPVASQPVAGLGLGAPGGGRLPAGEPC
jgi:hypothetical protein